MKLSASKLRENVYRILDQVLATGEPVDIERKGKILRIVPTERSSKLGRLKPRKRYLKADPQSIVHLDWSGEWRP
jgi:antitoxin (DNA-binding transcriptional repressor) of toxin-antitoxin stability system